LAKLPINKIFSDGGLLMTIEGLKQIIRDIPDFPKKGIIFKDITTLLKNKSAFRETVDAIYEIYKDKHIDYVVGIESRGFIFGSILAYKLNAGFVPVRKKGKLPSSVISKTYELEYGTDTLEIHKDALSENDNVLVADDLLATGGTVGAVVSMLKDIKCNIVGLSFLIELEFLKGRESLQNLAISSLIKYS
jgi:adenine phosphoribosyltransferase